MAIAKNTHPKACREEDEERRFLWGNPKDFIFKILPVRINKCGCKTQIPE
jgi:hypothetical protein